MLVNVFDDGLCCEIVYLAGHDGVEMYRGDVKECTMARSMVACLRLQKRQERPGALERVME